MVRYTSNLLLFFCFSLKAFSQDTAPTYKWRSGINAINIINNTLDINVDYGIKNYLNLGVRAGHTFDKDFKYGKAAGTFVKIGIVAKLNISSKVYLFSGFYGGVSGYNQKFDIPIEYFYGTYRSRFTVKGSSKGLSIPLGYGLAFNHFQLDVGTSISFVEPINDSLMPEYYFLPGFGFIYSANTDIGISPFINLSYCF